MKIVFNKTGDNIEIRTNWTKFWAFVGSSLSVAFVSLYLFLGGDTSDYQFTIALMMGGWITGTYLGMWVEGWIFHISVHRINTDTSWTSKTGLSGFEIVKEVHGLAETDPVITLSKDEYDYFETGRMSPQTNMTIMDFILSNNYQGIKFNKG